MKQKKHIQRHLFKSINVVAVLFLLFGGVAPAALAVESLNQTDANQEQVVLEENIEQTEMKADTETPFVESPVIEEPPEKASDVTKIEETSVPVEVTPVEKEQAPLTPAADPAPTAPEPEERKLTILGTTDVHGSLWDWSYEDSAPKDGGLAKISTIVNETRAIDPDTILVDAGDNIQGTLLTDDLYNVKPELLAQTHPMIKAMNYMQYDSMSLGNHEFNFGLGLIEKIRNDANFPLLSANTYKKADGTNLVDAYKIKEVKGVKVGVLGLTIPHVPMWDGAKVESLEFRSLREEAKKQVRILKDVEQVDVIVAAIHAGLKNSDPEAAAENVIKEVPEIDAFVIGHDHKEVAQKMADYTGKEKPVGAAKDTGTGVVKIELELNKPDTKWEVTGSSVEVLQTANKIADPAVKELTQDAHETVVEFIQDPIGTAKADFLPEAEIPGIPEAQLQPTAMISLINNVQMKVTGADIAAGALFKANSHLDAGPITFADVFDIYKYPNTLIGVEIKGDQLKRYMESQANYYNQYKKGDVTIGFNEKIRVYNYDMFTGVNYKIDISKPTGSRIVDLTYQGKPVADSDTFKLAINNYRYEGLVLDGIITAEPYYVSDPITLRSSIVDYIAEKGEIDPEVENGKNWEIIGADLEHPLRSYIIEQIKLGTNDQIKIVDSDTGRTPNVKTLNADELIAAGAIPDDVLASLEKLTIMHTNDMHGRMLPDSKNNALGLAKLKTYKKQVNPTLMVDSGDAFQGLPISNYSKGFDMAKAMNEVGYDAMTFGNHEFDFGYDVAMQYKEKLNFPIVSANIYKDGVRSFDPYTIVEKNGKKYAIIGLTTPETATKTHPNNVKGVTFKDPIPEAKAVLAELKGQADAYVFLTHLGIDETTPTQWRGDTLAKTLSEDPDFANANIVVLDGHSHSELPAGKQFGKVMLAQTGNHLNNVGLVEAKFSDPVAIKASLASASSLADLEEDVAVKAIVDQAEANFKEGTSEVIMENNPYLLNGERDNVRARETNLGNLISDALSDYGQTGFANKSDFAVINGGGIRANIPAGKVTKGDVISVLPFGNIISQVAATGDQVYAMFEHSLRSLPKTDEAGQVILDENGLPALGANGGFLQTSESIKVYYDSNKKGANPEASTAGERILRVKILNETTGKYEDLKRDKTYYVTTNDFLAAGGDGFTMLGGSREEGPSMDEIVIDYLREASQLRLVRAAEKVVDLSKYAKELPGERIISMTEADFNKMEKPVEPGKPGEGNGGVGEGGQGSGNGSGGTGTGSGNVGTNTGTNTGTGGSQATNGKKPTTNFPATGESEFSWFFSGFVLIVVGGAVSYVTRRKKVS